MMIAIAAFVILIGIIIGILLIIKNKKSEKFDGCPCKNKNKKQKI